MLLKACRRSVPEGSRYRLGWLERGRCICWKAWPDGRSAKERLKVIVVEVVKEAEEEYYLKEKPGNTLVEGLGRCSICSRRVCSC